MQAKNGIKLQFSNKVSSVYIPIHPVAMGNPHRHATLTCTTTIRLTEELESMPSKMRSNSCERQSQDQRYTPRLLSTSEKLFTDVFSLYVIQLVFLSFLEVC